MDTRYSRLARLALLGIVTAALVGSIVTTLPAVAALDGASGATYTNPRAPGGDGRYTVTLVAQGNDTIVRNGLQEITLDFGADRDFSGDVTRVTSEDVEVYLESRNRSGAISLGAVNVSATDERVTVTLESVVRSVGPNDRIVVRVANVTNTEIAARDPRGVRSFAMWVTTTGPHANSDGPVEVRYEIDPNATASTTNVAATNTTSGANATAATGANESTGGTDDGAASDGRNASNATDTAAAPAGGSGPTSGGALASAVSGRPTIVGVGAIGSLAVAVLGVTYVVYDRREGREKDGSRGGRERL